MYLGLMRINKIMASEYICIVSAEVHSHDTTVIRMTSPVGRE